MELTLYPKEGGTSARTEASLGCRRSEGLQWRGDGWTRFPAEGIYEPGKEH